MRNQKLSAAGSHDILLMFFVEVEEKQLSEGKEWRERKKEQNRLEAEALDLWNGSSALGER